MKNTPHEMFVILFIGAQSPECTWAETTFVYCSQSLQFELYNLMCLYILVCKLSLDHIFLTEYDPYLEVDIRS